MTPLVVRVLPDVPAIAKQFDYVVPEPLRDHVRVGTLVRIPLHGRRVGAWITAVGVEPPAGVALQPIAKVTGWGPSGDLIDLAHWAAWRWAGRPASLLRTASPPRAVHALPVVPVPEAPAAAGPGGPSRVLRLPPLADRYPVVTEALAEAEALDGHALVLCPSVGEAQRLAARLRRDGWLVALVAHDEPGAAAAGEWARARAGAHVVGARAGAWAPVERLRRALVLDEHDEAYQSEQSPTWHARDVVAERAARAGAACVLTSPCPTLEALAWGDLVALGPADERAGWPRVEVVDRRDEDPVTGGLYSPRLVDVLRSGARVVCLVNRTGRSRLLACASCGTLARCEACQAAVQQPEAGVLRCARCGTERPVVCLQCGATRLKNLRAGVSRAREELEALAGEPVVEVTAATAGHALAAARIHVGTEAVLHQVRRADVVAFLDLDQELGAPRYRATEQAFALLARAARLLRGASADGRLLLQTRQPEHPAVLGARHGDPTRVSQAEEMLRGALRMPPTTAMAVVSGAPAPAYVAGLQGRPGIEVQGPADGAWRIRAADHQTLCDALAAVERPAGRLRVEVDPLRI